MGKVYMACKRGATQQHLHVYSLFYGSTIARDNLNELWFGSIGQQGAHLCNSGAWHNRMGAKQVASADVRVPSVMCREASDSSQHHDIVIHANELSYKDGFSTGDIIRCDSAKQVEVLPGCFCAMCDLHKARKVFIVAPVY